MTYAILADLLDRMAIPSTSDNLALTSRLTDALDQATELINDDTGRNFAQRAGVAKTFTTTDYYKLNLPDFTAITSVKVDDTDDGTFETTIASSGYEPGKTNDGDDGWPYSSILLMDRCWPANGRRTRRIEITADWGWPAIPAGINKACTILAARLGAREASAVFGVQSFGDEGAGAYVRTNDPDYLHAIRRYVKPQVA